jgi:hypothetical protein
VDRERDTHEIGAGNDTARFAWLLAALVAALALPPLLPAVGFGIAGLRIGFAAVLVASVGLLSRNRRSLWLGLGLAVPALLLDWGGVAFYSRGLDMAASAVSIALFALVIWTILEVLIRAERVTTDTILGGVCVYLLLGSLWVTAFTLVENFQPGSFLLNGAPFVAERTEPFRYPEILYFSFVTLTTLGYGDINPVTPVARALATGEAIVGQLYVAIFVARLVGLHLAQARAKG